MNDVRKSSARASRRSLRWLLLCCICTSWMLSGMICDRVADVAVRVKKDFLFQLRPDDALARAGITDQNGKVPDNLPRTEFPLSLNSNLDLTNNAEFQRYRDQVRRIHINRVWLTLKLNNSPVELTQGEIALAPVNEQGQAREQDFANGLVASTPAIEPGVTDLRIPLTWEAGGIEQTLKLIRQFRFAVRYTSSFRVQSGARYPVGEVQVQLEFEMTFVVGIL